MNDANARAWTGGAYWHRRGTTPRSKDAAVWATRYATWPFVELRLGKEGGALLHARSGEEVAFGWREVGEMGRARVLAFPFLGEGVRVTLEEEVARGTPRRLLFFSWSKGRTMDILRFAESKGVRIERRAKNKLTVP